MSYVITFIGLVLGGIVTAPILHVEWEHEAILLIGAALALFFHWAGEALKHRRARRSNG